MSDECDPSVNKDITTLSEEHLASSDEKIKWWGYGEWVEEPDKIEFQYNGYNCRVERCMVRKNESYACGGYLCGYVRLPLNISLHDRGFDLDFDIHWGITYNEIQEDDHNWIGFDCAHSDDVMPSSKILEELILFPVCEDLKKYSIFNPTYRNITFCIQQCKSLADQIEAMVVK